MKEFTWQEVVMLLVAYLVAVSLTYHLLRLVPHGTCPC
jgi:hypothetical protein